MSVAGRMERVFGCGEHAIKVCVLVHMVHCRKPLGENRDRQPNCGFISNIMLPLRLHRSCMKS